MLRDPSESMALEGSVNETRCKNEIEESLTWIFHTHYLRKPCSWRAGIRRAILGISNQLKKAGEIISKTPDNI